MNFQKPVRMKEKSFQVDGLVEQLGLGDKIRLTGSKVHPVI